MKKELLSQISSMKCRRCQARLFEFWDEGKTSVFMLCPRCDARKIKICLMSGKVPIETISYLDYRNLFKLCETCGQSTRGHPRCQTCHILCGPGHDGHLTHYRGYKICDSCMINWIMIESQLKRQISLKEFKSGILGRSTRKERTEEKLAAGRAV